MPSQQCWPAARPWPAPGAAARSARRRWRSPRGRQADGRDFLVAVADDDLLVGGDDLHGLADQRGHRVTRRGEPDRGEPIEPCGTRRGARKRRPRPQHLALNKQPLRGQSLPRRSGSCGASKPCTAPSSPTRSSTWPSTSPTRTSAHHCRALGTERRRSHPSPSPRKSPSSNRSGHGMTGLAAPRRVVTRRGDPPPRLPGLAHASAVTGGR